MSGIKRLRPAIAGAAAGALTQCGALWLEHGLQVYGNGVALLLAAVAGAAMTTYGAVLHEQSIRDDGTGLFNRRYLFRRLHREWREAGRQGRKIALAVLDVDDFRQYNNRFGHLAGDVVLQSVARTLQANLRKRDIIGRWGGEEFAVILPDTNETEAFAAGERLRAAIDKLRLELDAERDVRVSISVGVTACRQDDGSPEPFVKRADAAMYTAKQSKNRTVLL